MSRVSRILTIVGQRNDVFLAALLVAVIFMMILPLPTALIDFLVATNMMIGILLLMVALYLPSPTQFTAFPAVLLITTLFRLAIAISTTRLILLQADAGHIIQTFGEFVVGGNLIVGIVVFLIITVVQFVVITKGAERVAEVSARFSLDAMPGKQMSIDGDMRAGSIDMAEAKRRRNNIERESQLYGSMDGAMKFIKGDAIATLIIIVVNIVGGLAIGTTQRGLSAGQALELYSILTIGDALVSQIPALLIAISAGIIVTRVSSEEAQVDLGSDIGSQLVGQPRALMVAAVIVFLFALVPGFPALIFVGLGTLIGAGGYFLSKSKAARAFDAKKQAQLASLTRVDPGPGSDASEDEVEELGAASYQFTTPLIIDVASASRGDVDPQRLNRELIRLRRALYFDLGVPFPGIFLRFNPNLERGAYVILINEIPVAQARFGVGKLWMREDPDNLKIVGVPYETGPAMLPNLQTVWVSRENEERIKQLGMRYMTEADAIGYHLSFVLRRHAEEFLGIQETKLLVDAMERDYRELVKEAQRVLPIQKITEILKRLVNEDVSIRNLRVIFEALIEWAPKEKDTILLVEYVRGSLSRQICHKYRGAHNVLPAYMLTPEVEDKIRNDIRQTSGGSYLALDPAIVRKLVEKIKHTVGDLSLQPQHPVLLTSMDIRRYVRKLIEGELYELAVLSYQELTRDINIQPLGRISL
ncbi:MAG: type III secretion system export apparatus subunit SctV [Alphaproteobacteria bacterium]|nr:type III secretion system export apparatus subunit SctV [Alphaproteobacteria bacterium]